MPSEQEKTQMGGGQDDVRVVDVQGHLMPDDYFEELSSRAATDSSYAAMLDQTWSLDPDRRLRRTDDVRIAAMDAAGIDVQVISLTAPAAALVPRERSAELAGRLNNALLDAAGRYPGRFLVLCSLPFPHVEESVAELDRLAEDPRVRGALIDVHTTGFTIDEPRFEPIYARLAELEMPAVIHPAGEVSPAFRAWGISSSLGAMTSTALAGLRLILSGMLDRVPQLDLVIPHLAGTIPYVTQRVTDLSGRGDARHDLLHYLHNRIWTDSCSYWPPALRCAIETLGGDRIMLGSDYPFRGPLDTCVRDLGSAGLDDETRTAILGRTAARWFAEKPRRAAASRSPSR
jgi:predicted TIM-barrel fold metal-dependent hydrolase